MSDLIADLGGSTAIRKWLLTHGFNEKTVPSPSGIGNWRGRRIPPTWRLAIRTMAREKGVELPPDFLTPLTGIVPASENQVLGVFSTED